MPQTHTFAVCGKQIELLGAKNPAAPLVLLPTYEDEGADVFARLEPIVPPSPGVTLAAIREMDWDADLSPWPAPALLADEPQFSGGAEHFLTMLTQGILPEIRARLARGNTTDAPAAFPAKTPHDTGDMPTVSASLPQTGRKSTSPVLLAGYSLAGLFALYALYRTDVFAAAVSASGSLWYPGFLDFARKTPLAARPRAIELSLGGKEARAPHPLLQTVEENTRSLVQHYKTLGLPVHFTPEKGGHTHDAHGRMARAIGRALATLARRAGNGYNKS